MITVQNVFQQFYYQFNQSYFSSNQQTRVCRDILRCRTAELGGHSYVCGDCGHVVIHYNSCRNRHCPSCQGLSKAIWIDKRSKDVLDAPYFHTVFTIPQELHSLVYQNQELLYNLLYHAVAQTLQELSADRKYLGAQIGFFSVLHTWSQDLHYHPHIHTVVLAGGLTKEQQWRNSSKKFFIPVKVLAKKFRGKFLHQLKHYYKEGLLHVYGDAEQYQNPSRFQALLTKCYRQSWYCYTKRTFSGPLAVVKYLGRYTHRIAIGNTRIVAMDEKTVTFTVKDRQNNQIKPLTLSGVEFIRRFLLHVLPKGFVKIRYYGLLANRNKKTKLELSRKLTGSQVYTSLLEGLNAIDMILVLTGKDVSKCPVCGSDKLSMVCLSILGSSP